MRKFAGIVESTIAPPTNCLWLCGHDAKYFSNGKWVSILSHENDADRKELEKKVDSIDKEIGDIKKDLSVFGSEQGVVELEIGDSDDVKVRNLKKLQSVQSNDHTFFTDINYGYGTASWLPSTGGNALIITSEGHAVKYTISTEGEVIKDEEFTLKEYNYVLPAATKTTLGGVKAGTNIVDIANPDSATASQVAGVMNTLLGQLRAAGILIS